MKAKSKKSIWLKHYLGWSWSPAASFIIISLKIPKYPEKLIQVNSLYINPKTRKIDYDQDSRQFDKEIAKIKKRLNPLAPLPQSSIKIQVLNKITSKEKSWYDPKQYIPNSTYSIPTEQSNLEKLHPFRQSFIATD